MCFFLYLVMIAWYQCHNGIDMGIFHNKYALVLCPFKTSFESLIILIPLLSNMEMQSLSHSCTKEISEALCS